MLDDARHVFQLSQFVAVVLGEHALGADDLVAEFAEVFDLFLRMAPAENLRRAVALRAKASEEGASLLLLLQHALLILRCELRLLQLLLLLLLVTARSL